MRLDLMKRYLILLVFLIAAVFLLQDCDKIDEPFVMKTGGSDTTECPVPDFPENPDPVKRVLLEDYTGHTCVNCPSAARIAHDLKNLHGDRLVIIAVHAGFFAMPLGTDFPEDFRTETGNDWDGHFGIGAIGNPNGMVDRTGYDQTHVLSPSAWAGTVNTRLATEPVIDIQIINDYSETERRLCAHIQTVFLVDTDRNLKLCVVMTESGVIAPQKNNDPQIGSTPVIEDYEHDHMLRTAINCTWGVPVATPGVIIPADTHIIKSYKLILEEEWAAENCNVIAFVYDANTYEVIQVMEEKVVNR